MTLPRRSPAGPTASTDGRAEAPGEPILRPCRLLVVEDDERFAALVERFLIREGHAVEVAHDGVAGLTAALRDDHDAVLLDVMRPGIDGFSVVRRLRESRVTVPVLMISAREAESDRRFGRRAGADDYLTKPFTLAELAERLERQLRRSAIARSPVAPERPAPRSGVLCVYDLALDLADGRVSRGGYPVVLRPAESALLEELMRRAGRTVPLARAVQVCAEAEAEAAGPDQARATFAGLRAALDLPDRCTNVVEAPDGGFRLTR
jgi:two-component system OmpR family response regulator